MRWDDGSRTLTLEPRENSAKKPDRPRRFEVVLTPGNTRKSVEYAGERVGVTFD
jgi:hypothetical protein